jgi:hypothetical protein
MVVNTDERRFPWMDEGFNTFINFYDRNGDGRITLSSSLTAGTSADGQTPEFTADDDLGLLVDGGTPDRNRNGIAGWVDSNRNGRWDVGEAVVFLLSDAARWITGVVLPVDAGTTATSGRVSA